MKIFRYLFKNNNLSLFFKMCLQVLNCHSVYSTLTAVIINLISTIAFSNSRKEQ